MTGTALKPNPFKEKMTAIKIVNPENTEPLWTVNYLDSYPSSVALVAFLDFFNLKPNTNYVISLTANLPDGSSYPVHATRINIPTENFVLINEEGYGKAAGNFTFNFTIEKPTDCYFLFALMDENSEVIDTAYSYHYFGKWS